MKLVISADGAVALEEIDDLKRFDIRADRSAIATSEAFHRIASPAQEPDHYWLDARQIVGLAGREGDAGWVEAFWAMLRKVEAYGYSDVATQRIKAHVVAG